MKYGLIGEKLGHSFSPQIHAALGSTPYELKELQPEELEGFLLVHDFEGINVTIPYKQAVIPYLTRIDPAAERIGAVNTVVPGADGGLTGYNTDYAGMKYALKKAGIRPEGKKALILGSGGTSKTARTVLADLGATEIIIVSRKPVDAQTEAVPENHAAREECGAPENTVKERLITGDHTSGTPRMTDYEHAVTDHRDAQIIINTTPVGMYPKNGKSPVDLSRFPSLTGVMDVIYNPLKTALLLQAEELHIPCTGGLPMLVAQAKAAADIFLKKPLPDRLTDTITAELRDERRNLILVGMPGSGKTTAGTALAELLGREFIDLDGMIEETAGMPVPEIFEKRGEAYFRDLETAVAAKAGAELGKVIATGGGIVLREENYASLAQNGYIVKLERDLAKLPLDGRPLSKSPEALAAMEKRRAPYYKRFADAEIDNNGTLQDTIDHILIMFERKM